MNFETTIKNLETRVIVNESKEVILPDYYSTTINNFEKVFGEDSFKSQIFDKVFVNYNVKRWSNTVNNYVSAS